MILVKNSKYLANILFCNRDLGFGSNHRFLYIFPFYVSVKETLVLSFDDVVFSKGGFLDY